MSERTRDTTALPQKKLKEDFKRKFEQARALIKARMGDRDLVEDLFAERRWEFECETAEAEGRPRPPHPFSDA